MNDRIYIKNGGERDRMSDQARIGFHLFTRTCEPIFVEKMRYSSAQNPNRSNAMDFCVEKSFRGGEKGRYASPHFTNISQNNVFATRQRKQFIFWEDIAYKSRTTRVTLLSILDIARHYVPALFSTNHQWTRRRLGTACSGPTSGPSTARQSRARRTIDFVWTRWFWWTICS